MSFFKKAFKAVKKEITDSTSAQDWRDAGSALKRLAGHVATPQFRSGRWWKFATGLRDKSPYAPPDPWDVDVSKIRTPEEARNTIDDLIGVDGNARREAEAIFKMKDEGGTARFVDVLQEFGFTGQIGGMPYSPEGDAMLATGNFATDPITLMNQDLGNRLESDNRLAIEYMRLSDPLTLLPMLVPVERDTERVGQEKSNNFLDMIGRPFAAVKDIAVAQLHGRMWEAVEEALGDNFYQNTFPDPYLRQVMAKRFYASNLMPFWGNGQENQALATLEAERLMAADMSSEERAAQFEFFLNDNLKWGVPGFISTMVGQMLFDPLWLAGPVVKVVGAPLKILGITLPRAGAVARLVTPTGRTIALDNKGIKGLFQLAGIKTLYQMPEKMYQAKRLLEPKKGITALLFERPAQMEGQAIQTRFREMIAGIGDDLVRDPNLIDDLSTTFLKGEAPERLSAILDTTRLLNDPRMARLSGLAQRDGREIWRKFKDQITGFLDNQEELGAWRPGISPREAAELVAKDVDVLTPQVARDLILGGMSWVAKQAAEESQLALWNATSTGRALSKFMFPASSGIRTATAFLTINNPGFVFLNVVSNSVRLMWHSAFHPLSGAEALTRSFWLETGTILKGGGRYPKSWLDQLSPIGWTARDVELAIAGPTGAHDLLLGKPLGVIVKGLADEDTLATLQKAQLYPAKDIGARFRFFDTIMSPVYAAGRVDKATRRAFFVSNLRTQKSLSLAPGGGFFNAFGRMREGLTGRGVPDNVITEIESGFADEIGMLLMEGDVTLTPEIISKALRARADRMLDGDASTLISFNAEARSFVETQLGITSRQGQAIAMKDLDEVVDWANRELPNMIDAAQKSGTAEAFGAFRASFSDMIRTKVDEYKLEQEITRGLARHADIIRPSTFSRSLDITSESIRADMADKINFLDRTMAVAFPTTWASKHPSIVLKKSQFLPLAHDATTANAQRLEQIKRLQVATGAGEADQIARDTIVSRELMDTVGLADDLRPAVADVAPVVRRAQPEQAFREGPAGRIFYDPDVPLSEARTASAAEAERLAIEKGRRIGATNALQRRSWATARARTEVLDQIATLRAEGLDDAVILQRMGQARGLLSARSSRGSLRGLGDDVVGRRTGASGIPDDQIQISASLDVLDDFVQQGRLPLGAAPAPVANIGNLSDDQLMPFLQRLRQATADDRARLLADYPIEAEQIQLLIGNDAAAQAWAQASAPRTLASIQAAPSLGALPAPPPPGDGATFGQIWDLYRARSRASLDNAYDFVTDAVSSRAVVHRNRVAALRKLDEEVFEKQQDILRVALAGGTKEDWAAASEQFRNLFQNMAARRGTVSGLMANDLPQAMKFNDVGGVLAREMDEFGEFLIDSMTTKGQQILDGELKLGDATLLNVHGAIDDVANAWPEVRDTIIANSRLATDFGMLNYLDQSGLDRIFQMVFPFEFWPTRDAFNWAIRGARAPGAFGALMIMMLGSERVAEQYGYPKRLQHRFPILLPGLDDFMQSMPGLGKLMDAGNFSPVFFIDTMRFIFPYTYLRDQYDDERRRNTVAGRILDFTQNVTPLNIGPFQTFVGRHTGLLDKDAWRSNYLSGGPFGIPMTEVARKTAQFVFNGDRDAIPEDEQVMYMEQGHFSIGWLNEIMGLNDDEFAIWRADRALVSLLADGQLIPGASQEEQLVKAQIALDSHKGPEWKKAVKASRAEQYLRRITHWIGFPMGDIVGVNEGEMIWFGLKGLHAEYARQGKLAEFYEKFPEFQLRSAAVRGLSDPQERDRAIDTELYYEGVDKYVNEPFEEAITEIEYERDRLRGMEQTQAVRDQLRVIDTQLDEIRQAKDDRFGDLERAFPFREAELSLNRSPRERALRQARTAWFAIRREDGEEYDAFLARREAFLGQFPGVEDDARHELDLWDLEKQSIFVKIKANRARNAAFVQNNFDKAREIALERDSELEQLHTLTEQVITRQDVEQYLGSFSNPRTPQQREFEAADAIFDLWMSLVDKGTPFTGREKAAMSEFFTSLPEIQKFYPLETVGLENLTFDQRLALMTRRDFWRTYTSIRDANVQLDYLRTMKPEVDQANRLLGLPPIEILDIPPYPAESSGDPLFDHIRMMSALNRRRELEEDESLTADEQLELERLIATLGDNPEDTALTADDVDRYIRPYSTPDEAPSP